MPVLLDVWQFVLVPVFFRAFSGHCSVFSGNRSVFVFLLYLADACNVDLSEAVRRKLEVNERKYPVDKSYNSHRKYTELT